MPSIENPSRVPPIRSMPVGCPVGFRAGNARNGMCIIATNGDSKSIKLLANLPGFPAAGGADSAEEERKGVDERSPSPTPGANSRASIIAGAAGFLVGTVGLPVGSAIAARSKRGSHAMVRTLISFLCSCLRSTVRYSLFIVFLVPFLGARFQSRVIGACVVAMDSILSLS